VSVVSALMTAPREGALAGRWAPRAVRSVRLVFFRVQSAQSVEEFVFLGPALQVEADPFKPATADVVAESQAHQECGDQGTIHLDQEAFRFVAQQMTAAQNMFAEAEEPFDRPAQLVQGAECELSCLTSQCLADRRIGDLELLQFEIGTWSEKTNTKQRGVDWHFQLEDARIKLKKLYPKIET
jgi:hypothetical protein